MENKDDHTIDRRSFLKTTGAAGTAAALANVASAGGPLDEVSFGENRQQARRNANELVVGVSSGTSLSDVQNKLPGAAEVKRTNEDLRYVLVELSDGMSTYSRMKVQSEINRVDAVKYTEKNGLMWPMSVDSGASGSGGSGAGSGGSGGDPLRSQQYAPQQVRAPSAWNVTQGEDVTVAVVDQGVDYEHPDLKEQFDDVVGKDFVDDDDDPMPNSPTREYHGTHVAGITAATSGNGKGVSGISNATLLSCRALGVYGGSFADIADAIQWAADQGADIINMSLGGGGYNETMKAAVSYAHNNGTLSICAAGNSGTSEVSYPARYNECMAISAIDEDEYLASFSQTGPNVDLAGPGVAVLSCWPEPPEGKDKPYNRISGTSMSTPAVSGVAALVKGANPDFGPTEIRNQLKETAVDIGLSEQEQGAGRVDAARAVGASQDGDNTGPSVSMDVRPIDPHVGETTVFAAGGSSDSDGYIDKWEWTVDGGQTMTGEQAYHEFSEPGEHTVKLTVTDDDGKTASDERVIEVQRGSCGAVSASAEFSGQLSPGGDINKHHYVFESEEPCSLKIDMDDGDFLPFVLQGSLRDPDFIKVGDSGDGLELTARDLRQVSTSSELEVGAYAGMFSRGGEYSFQVEEKGFGQPENKKPEAKFTASSTTVQPDEEITFDASPSSDAESKIEYFVWTFGDGSRKRGKKVEHSFDATGEFAVSLTVYDKHDATDTTSKTISVTDGKNKGGACGQSKVTQSFDGKIAPDQNSAVHSHTVKKKPCKVTIDLSGPKDADYDLYVTLDGRKPTPTDYDKRSWNNGSQETVTIEGEEISPNTELGILVDSYMGSGKYTLDVSEAGKGKGGQGGKQPDGGDGACNTVTKEDAVSDTIDWPFGSSKLKYETQTDEPCRVEVKLDGPRDADMDMFVNNGGAAPQAINLYEADFLATTPNSQESVIVEEPQDEIGIRVQAKTGTGDLSITVTEFGR